MTSDRPSVLHADFNPVTQARPARAGEVLIILAKGLGPARNNIPGQAFPAEPLAIVNSPVEVLVNGGSVAAINQIGVPATPDMYGSTSVFRTERGRCATTTPIGMDPESAVTIPIR